MATPIPPDVKLIPQMACPHCAYTFTAVGTCDQSVATDPKPGDRTVCMKCVAVLIFSDTMTLRGMTVEEFEALSPAEHREIAEIAGRIHIMHAVLGPPGPPEPDWTRGLTRGRTVES